MNFEKGIKNDILVVIITEFWYKELRKWEKMIH